MALAVFRPKASSSRSRACRVEDEGPWSWDDEDDEDDDAARGRLDISDEICRDKRNDSKL